MFDAAAGPQCATSLCAQCAAPYRGPYGVLPNALLSLTRISLPFRARITLAAAGVLTTDNSAHDPKCPHFRRSPSSNVHAARAAADAQELGAEMKRLEKIFGAQLSSSRPSSQASFRSQSPPSSLNSLNSISALLPSEFPTRAQHTSPAAPSPASPLHTQQAEVVWMPDADAPRCLSCNKSFFLFRRRHHCRTCGLVFCSRCCTRFVLRPHSSAVLTCFSCQHLNT